MFFSYANTVVLISQNSLKDMDGLEFATKLNQMKITTKLYFISVLKKQMPLTQETLGNIGVNLIYGYTTNTMIKKIVYILYDHLDKDQLEMTQSFGTSF
jgi:hypothetical protein